MGGLGNVELSAQGSRVMVMNSELALMYFSFNV